MTLPARAVTVTALLSTFMNKAYEVLKASASKVSMSASMVTAVVTWYTSTKAVSAGAGAAQRVALCTPVATAQVALHISLTRSTPAVNKGLLSAGVPSKSARVSEQNPAIL